MDQPADLFANRRDDPLGAVAQQVAAPAREEVEIAVALGVPHPRSLAANEADGVSAIIGDHVPIELGDRRTVVVVVLVGGLRIVLAPDPAAWIAAKN